MSVVAGMVIFAIGVAVGRLLRRGTDWWSQAKSDSDEP